MSLRQRAELALAIEPLAKRALIYYRGSESLPPDDIVPGRRLVLPFHHQPNGDWEAALPLSGDDSSVIEKIVYLMSMFGFTVNL
jgi:hypothetical protein